MEQSQVSVKYSHDYFVQRQPYLHNPCTSCLLNKLLPRLIITQLGVLNLTTEFCLVLLQLLHDPTMRVPDRLRLEQPVHPFQWHTLRLGDEEENEDNGADHQASEEEVDAIRHLSEHLRREPGDEEVPQPVAGRGHGLCQRTHVGIEHLRVQDPWRTVPRWSVARGPDVEEDDCHDASAVELGARVVFGVFDLDVGADNPEADGASQSTPEEQLATADVVDQEEQPDDGYRGLDDTENARHDLVHGPGDADTLEHRGTVVVDGVDTGAILPEEEHESQEQSPHHPGIRAGCLEWLPETSADLGLLLLQGLVDAGDLLDNVDVVLGQLANPA